jgi:hypothetical protein
VPVRHDKAVGRGAVSGTQQTSQGKIMGSKDRLVHTCCGRRLGHRVGLVPVPRVSGSSCRHEWGEQRRESAGRRRYQSDQNLNTHR